MKTKLIIFGITGDLSQRKLLPALRHIVADGADIEIIGVSRREIDATEVVGEDLAGITKVFTMDLTERVEYEKLVDFIDLQASEQALIYLSVPPANAADIADFLGEVGFNGSNVKILFEKPFGFDLESAHDYLDRTGKYFTEEQIYRIDHYAAKEVANNLINLRRNAASHHHAWGKDTIASVGVLASETIDIEGRAVFYEQTGALRDILQGHLLQLLALVLLDAKEQDTPQARLKALENLVPAKPDEAVRAQYEGYEIEVENPGSLTETFASVTFESTDTRWAGVPLTLTTGKALDSKRSWITIRYKDGSEEVFDEEKSRPDDGRKLDAYERVILDAISGNKTVFTTGPEVIRAWELVQPILDAWGMDDTPLDKYPKGTNPSDIIERLYK